jgi:acyl-CoA synthetase (AMP-forming)/AMP-acid ligase II
MLGNVEAGPRGLQTIGRTLSVNTKRVPNKTALSTPRGALTYRELNTHVNQLAHCLIGRGLKRGDNIAVLFSNTIEHVITLYAVAKIGLVSVVLDPKWVPRELAEALSLFDCNFLIADSALADDRFHAAIGRDFPAISFGGAGGFSFDQSLKKFPSTDPPCNVSDDDIFLIMLTSGTTGRPKGCIATHKSYWHTCALTCISTPVDEDSRELLVVPICYNSGRSSLITQFFVGGTVFLRERLDPREALETIQRERITCLALAPTQCNELLAFADLNCYDTTSLRLLRKAGLPFQRRIVQDIAKRITPNLFQGYGGTEFSAAAQLSPDEQLTKLGSSGRAMLGVEIEIVSDDRIPLPTGASGEIRVRSPSVCHGYYNNETATAAAFSEGWYYSGDLGYLDDDGYLYVVGRKKDVIKTGGINVAPREVEEVILSFEEVADVAVVGVPDDKWGEVIKALIVLKGEQQLSKDDIVARCTAQLSRYKIPKTIEFVDHISRNALGKMTESFKATVQT